VEREINLSRRGFIGAAAGAAGAAAVAAWPASRAFGRAGANPVDRVLPENRGIILFSVRDAVGRNPLTAMPGALAGFNQVLRRLSEIGYKQIEFAGYTQNANNPEGAGYSSTVPGTGNTVLTDKALYFGWAQTLRSYLDAYGLKANGTHAYIPSTIDVNTSQGAFNLERFKMELEFAAILGMEHYGTGSDPTGSAQKSAWDAAIVHWEQLGAIAKSFGLKLYTHNHDAAYNFLLDRGPLDASGNFTRSSGWRRIEYFMRHTDPDLVYYEMDIYWAHVAQHRWISYTTKDGTVVNHTLDPAGVVRGQSRRFPLFHAKDGDRLIDPATGQPTAPGVGNGYVFVPFGTGDINFKAFFDRIGANKHHIAMWEQDNAGGSSQTAEGQAQSMQFAQVSYTNMAALGPTGS
jgi:sugar phosphate isomerase/epimerase